MRDTNESRRLPASYSAGCAACRAVPEATPPATPRRSAVGAMPGPKRWGLWGGGIGRIEFRRMTLIFGQLRIRIGTLRMPLSRCVAL